MAATSLNAYAIWLTAVLPSTVFLMLKTKTSLIIYKNQYRLPRLWAQLHTVIIIVVFGKDVKQMDAMCESLP
jgi:hypothetical protein